MIQQSHWRRMGKHSRSEMTRKTCSVNSHCSCSNDWPECERDEILGSRMLISFEFYHILPDLRLSEQLSLSFHSVNYAPNVRPFCFEMSFPNDYHCYLNVLHLSFFFVIYDFGPINCRWFFQTLLPNAWLQSFAGSGLPQIVSGIACINVSGTAKWVCKRIWNPKNVLRNKPHHHRADPICMKMDEFLQPNTSPNKCFLLSI